MRWIVAFAMLAACWSVPVEKPLPPVFDGIALTRPSCLKNALMMPADIDGHRGWFIIDSGAFVSVVYEDFARKANLSLTDNADRLGGGYGVHVFKVVAQKFEVPGLPGVAKPDFMMMEKTASPLADDGGCNVAGVISPAALSTPELAVLVDLGADRLTRIPVAKIDEHLARIPGPRFSGVTASNEYTPGIDVAFGGHRLRMMIDTGACCTWITTTSKLGQSLHPKSKQGSEIKRLLGTTTSRIVRTDFTFGRVDRTIEIKLLDPDAGDAAETGGIGADALRGCILAITPVAMHGVCR